MNRFITLSGVKSTLRWINYFVIDVAFKFKLNYSNTSYVNANFWHLNVYRLLSINDDFKSYENEILKLR